MRSNANGTPSDGSLSDRSLPDDPRTSRTCYGKAPSTSRCAPPSPPAASPCTGCSTGSPPAASSWG